MRLERLKNSRSAGRLGLVLARIEVQPCSTGGVGEVMRFGIGQPVGAIKVDAEGFVGGLVISRDIVEADLWRWRAAVFVQRIVVNPGFVRFQADRFPCSVTPAHLVIDVLRVWVVNRERAVAIVIGGSGGLGCRED